MARPPSGKNPIISIRELTKDDLPLIKGPAAPPQIIKKLRDTHHALARLIAAGCRYDEAAARSGYTYNSVRILARDPAFKNLVEHYRGIVTDSFRDTMDTFAQASVANMMRAERQLADHLEIAEESGELLPVAALVRIAAERADRFGYGKKTTNVNVNIDFAAKLEAATKRSSKVLELAARPGPPPPPPRSDDDPVAEVRHISRRA